MRISEVVSNFLHDPVRAISQAANTVSQVVSTIAEAAFENMTTPNLVKGAFLAATLLTGYLALKGMGMVLTAASIASVIAGIFLLTACGTTCTVMCLGIAGYAKLS